MMESPYHDLVDVCLNSAMSSLRNMTTDQLEQILNSDTRIKSIIDALPQVRSLPSEREVGLTENKTLAEWNLAQESRISQLRSQVKENFDKAHSLKQEVETMKAKLDASTAGQNLDITNNLLQVAAQEADDDAESLAREFNCGSVSADLFLKQFHEKKTLYHLRKIKSDRLQTVLHDQQYAQPSMRISMPSLPSAYAPPANPRHSFF